MISYEPLRITLIKKKMKMSDLESIKGGPLNARTVAKLRKDQTMNIDSIDKVCIYLDVPIEEVVEIIREDSGDPRP
ncbi:helix-turn-helix domain-containing protein [Rossellomorea marisflavi]|uniref:helix-turn-helix domain-containing protein n=1 Tax=Rossellomorea marisflavi TaxID=189381 RepID=UPI0009A78744|nr:helix-turn-helix transcriptional regulator [Rossellomorea marisflavi]